MKTQQYAPNCTPEAIRAGVKVAAAREMAYRATEAIAGKYGAAGIDWIREALAAAYLRGKAEAGKVLQERNR